MNDKLEQLYNLYKQNGIIQSTDFNTFSTADDNQKKKLYDLGKQKGLFKTTDYNTFSSAFSPVKKKEPTASISPSGQKPTSSVTPAKKASGQPDYLSPTSDLGPKSPKMEFDYKTKKEAVVGEYKGYPGKEDNTYRVYNGNWQRKMPKQTNWQDVLNEGSVNALNKQFNQAVKYSKAKDKYKGVVEDKRELAKNELDTKLSSINSKLIDKEEDVVIPKLQKQFPNFKFAPSGTLTDEVKVIAPNNETIIISLDNWSSSSDTSEAELLRSFIRINSNTDKTTAEKELQQAEKQREYFDIKPFNPTIKIGEGYGDEKIITDLNKIVQPEGAPTDIMTADKELKSARKELMKQSEIAYIDVIDKVRVAAKTSGKIDDNEARADLAMLKSDWKETKAGEDYFNDISTQSTELKKQWTDLQTYVDGINTKLSIGEISQEQYENEYVPLMQKGLEDLQGKSLNLNNEYTTVQNVNNSIVRSSAENMIIQESRGSIAGGVAYGFTKGLTDVLRVATLGNLPKEAQEDLVRAVVGYGTTEEYMNSEERSDITKVLFSLSRTLGQAATGSFIGKGAALAGGSAKAVTTASAIPFFSSAYYEMKDQFDDPKFANISDAQKVLFSALYGTASAALEKYGLTKSVSKTPFGKNLTNTILASAIRGLPKNASEEAIKEAIEASIVNKIKSAGVSSIGAFVVEGATEATQKATEVALQESFDLLNKDNYFESGTAWDILSDVIYEGYLGGLGGSMMNVASNGARIATDGISKVLNKEQAKVLDIMTQTEGMNESFDTYLKGLVVSGDITPEEAGSMSNGFREVKAGFDKIPADIPVDQKTKAFDLIVERSKIEKEISGKEDNLVVVQKERIKEINNELQTISKDAVQEQAAGEVSVQPETTTSEEVVQGKPKSGPEVVTEEGKKEEIDAKQAEFDAIQIETIKKSEELQAQGLTNEEIESNPEFLSIRDRMDAAWTELDALKQPKETDTTETVQETPVTSGVVQEATQDQVTTLRAQEQVELAEAIPNIDEYKVDGEVDKNSMPADVLAKYNEIYDKYDKLITPLLTTAQEGPTVEQEITPESYVEELNNTIESDPETYWSVSPVDLETAKDSTIVGDSDGKGIVSKDGDIKGVFKSIGTKVKGVAEKILSAAVKVGGIKLDNFDGYLTKTYKKNGFRIVARVPFNEEFAPNGWNKEKHGTPDVVAMIYDPEGKLSIEEKSFTDYDEAMAYRDTFVEQARANKKASESVEQEVEAIGQLLSGTDQQIDQKAAKIANKKISKAVAKAAKAISKIIPGTKFVVHDTDESYRAATKEKGKSQSSNGSFNPKTNTIHINGTKANRRTVAHEVFHAILINKVKTDANAAAVTKRMVQAISAKIENNPALKKKLDDFLSNYEENIQNEEKLSELVGMLAENYNSMSTSIKDLLARWIDKLANMFGLDPFDRNETYDMLNTIARKVAKGKVISEADVKMFKGGEKVNSPSEGLTSRKQYGNENVKVEVRYLEQEKMDELIKKGLVQEVDNLSSINGQRVVTTSPDDMLVGSIYVNGKEVATGNGGIFFVTKFGDVWANSNNTVTKNLAAAINESSKANGGKAYLVLVKGSDAKLVSSPQGVTSSLAVTESMLDAGLFSLSDFSDAIRSAVKDAGGNISLSENGSAKTLKNELDSFFSDVTASTFEKRGNVLRSIIANLAKSKSALGNKAEIIKFLNGDITKGLGVGVTEKSQSLVDLIANVSAEQLTKGLNVGDIYGVIEIDGEVKVFQDKHQSYPYHIKMVDKDGNVSSKKPILILPKNRKSGREILTSIDGQTSEELGSGFSGKVGATSNLPYGKGIMQDSSTPSQIKNEVTAIEDSMTDRKQRSKSINDIVKITKDQGFSDAAIREYLKQQGFSDKQATDAINEYNVKKEGIFVRKDGGIPTKIVDSIRSFRRRMFSARAFLAKSIFSEKENKDAFIAMHLNIVDQNVKDFNRLYARYKGTKLEKEKLVEDFDAYIRGDKDVKLPEDFMAVANSMRNQIDGLSMQLISSGLVDAEMAQTIKDNLGQYLTRSYKIYDRANWKKEVENEVKQKAINLLKSQYREMAQEISNKEGIPLDEVLNNLVNNRLDEMLTTEGANNFITGSKLGSKDLSVLKERQDIPIEIRMLLGEYSDPALNYAKTVLKLSSLAANHKFLTEIKKTGMGVYFFEKNDPRRPADFNTMIAAEGSESMNPLNGLYTTKEIADAFMAQPSELGKVWKTFMKFQSSVRWLKTIGSVATHIKNVFGNLGFIWINAHVDPKEVGKAFMTVKNDFSKGTNQQRRDKMNNYISLGIVKQSAGLGEIMDMFKDADWDTAMASRLSNQKLGLIGKAKRFFLQGKKWLEDIYQAEDDFFKIVAYEHELSRYSKAMFDKNKSELTEEELTEVNKVVTEIVKNTYPTYDRIPEAVKMVRRAPFIGNFVSFQAESYRTAFNTIALAKDELASDNNKIKTIGALRIAGATTYLSAKSAWLASFSMAAGTGLTGLVGYLFDDEDEEQKDKDIRKFVAPWSKKSDLLIRSAGNGKIKYIDFSSSDPHGGMKKVMNAFFLGETTIDGFSEGIAETFAPFIGEDMTVEALLALKNNKDKYGNPIYNTEESLYDQSEKVLSYMYKLVEPGTFSSIRRGWEAEDKTNELVANITGFRTYDVDINKQFGYAMKDYSARIKNAKNIYNSAYYNEKTTPSEKEKAYKKAQESLNGIYSEITDLYNSAERLGCDPKDLGVAMDDFGNMSKRTVRDIKSGTLPELKKKD